MQVRVLGEIQVLGADGSVVALPASRKARGLLGYLAVTDREHLRSQLCDLLWSDATDPRSALRWCLSRLRKVLGDSAIIADRRRVGLAADAMTVDLKRVRRSLSGGVDEASIEELESAAAAFRGELLEGLDLLDDFRFHTWCTAEREAAGDLQRKILLSLSERVRDPERALAYARNLVAVDPMSEAAHTRVIRILGRLGRYRDAHDQLQAYKRVMALELGEVPRDAVKRMRRLVHADPPPPTPTPHRQTPEPAEPFVGRAATLRRLLDRLRPQQGRRGVCLLLGDPGLGKSRLCEEIARRCDDHLWVRAHRSETVRALGPWLDALGGIEWDDSRDRTALFEHIRVEVERRMRSVVLVDDFHWMDEASLALISVLARGGLGMVLAGRPEELLDNEHARRLTESLVSSGHAEEVRLEGLELADAEALCQAIAPGVDAGPVAERAAGNPFVLIELARAARRGDSALSSGLRVMVRERLARLSAPARSGLPWIAALGRTAPAALLAAVLESCAGVDLFPVLEELERARIVVPQGAHAYDFSHDIVREAAYLELSGPRRRLMHRAIARLLSDPRLGAPPTDLLRHAELGEDGASAAVACASAASEALRLCAWLEVLALADRGLHHLSALPPAERSGLALTLLTARIRAASSAGRRHPESVLAALDALSGLTAEQGALAHHLRSVVHEDAGRTDQAQQATERAAAVSETLSPTAHGRQLANTARCLLHLDRDIPRARSLIDAAARVVERDTELEWARGLLARWDGLEDEARSRLHAALAMSIDAEDRWREASIRATLTLMSIEGGDLLEAARLADEGLASEGGRDLKSRFLVALRCVATGDALDEALAGLRNRDAKVQLAQVLNVIAERSSNRQPDLARRCAAEALELAAAVGRPPLQVRALLTLASLDGRKSRWREVLASLLRSLPEDSLPRAVRTRAEGLDS